MRGQDQVPPARRSDPAGKGSPQTKVETGPNPVRLLVSEYRAEQQLAFGRPLTAVTSKRWQTQLPKSDPTWEGHKTGRLYWCTIPPDQDAYPVWLGNRPRSCTAPDPLVLAQQAIRTMALKAVRIGIVPEPHPGRIGVIGLPTWMWADGADRAHVGSDLPYGLGSRVRA